MNLTLCMCTACSALHLLLSLCTLEDGYVLVCITNLAVTGKHSACFSYYQTG